MTTCSEIVRLLKSITESEESKIVANGEIIQERPQVFSISHSSYILYEVNLCASEFTYQPAIHDVLFLACLHLGVTFCV